MAVAVESPCVGGGIRWPPSPDRWTVAHPATAQRPLLGVVTGRVPLMRYLMIT